MADINNQAQTTTGEPGNTTAQQEKTFTQADVDKMIQSRLDRERKKMPSEDELAAFRTWKDSQQTEQDRMNNITKEREDRTARARKIRFVEGFQRRRSGVYRVQGREDGR